MAKQGSAKMGIGKLALVIIGSLMGIIIISMIIAGIINSSADKKETNKSTLATRVSSELNSLGDDTKQSIASEPDGPQGDIIKVEDGTDGEIKVTISTDFSTPDEGRTIAKSIMANTCVENKDLDSLYVINQSTGLQSLSLSRDDIPACR